MNHLARALALALLAAPGFCQTPPREERILPTMSPVPPYAHFGVFLYDIEGKTGGLHSPGERSIIPSGEYAEGTFEGEEPVRQDRLSLGILTSRPIGTPFLARVYSPQFGSLLGFYRVTQFDPVIFHIPVKGSEVGLPPIRQENENQTVEEIMTIGFNSWIADNKILPTVTLFATWIPDIDDRQVFMEAQYLPGNRFEDLGFEHWDYVKGADNFDNPDGLWGQYIQVYGFMRPDFAGFTEEGAPIGPIRVELGYEGYGTDSIEFVGENKKFFGRVNMLFGDFSSDPSVMTPSEIMGLTTLSVPEHRFILDPAIREDLLGQSRLFTNLLSASDVNHDGVIDAADYLIVRPQVLPTPTPTLTPTPGGTPTPFPTATPFAGFGGGTKSDRYRGARGGNP